MSFDSKPSLKAKPWDFGCMNKEKLNPELWHMWYLIRVEGSFKKPKQQKSTNHEEQIFKINSKEKWTPTDDHHSIEIFIDLV